MKISTNKKKQPSCKMPKLKKIDTKRLVLSRFLILVLTADPILLFLADFVITLYLAVVVVIMIDRRGHHD